MFDPEYFRTTLPRDVEALGGKPVVELQMTSGHMHRLRAVVEIATGHLTVEAYHAKGDLAHERPRFGDDAQRGAEQGTFRVVVAYEHISAIIIDPAQEQARVRPGFASS